MLLEASPVILCKLVTLTVLTSAIADIVELVLCTCVPMLTSLTATRVPVSVVNT